MYKSHVAEPLVSQKIGDEGPNAVTTTFIVSCDTFGKQGCQLTNQEEAPEPIHNVFEEVNPPSEEKTFDPVGPKNDVQMLESTAVPGEPFGSEVEKPEDTRAPVGLDAGAPAVTADAEQDGWHGGAEDDGKKAETDIPPAKLEDKPWKPRVEVEKMELDDEAKRLAEEVMEQVNGERDT